ncbi:BMC domain-containing protein [Providencia sp.]|uniref:BMC domain-containing protein n=1 Tax=Providencia sp. TaxID=589 RepID=UPI000E8973C1|nr:BMC domain-containing protein [Providencia sp.]HBO24512.1 ethanolamine utilization protein [Providencia sp.]
MKSLGVIETKGLVSAIKAADAACKAASVEVVGYRKIGSGLISIYFQGEISAVHTAIDHGISVIADSQLLVGSLVIARPDPSVITKLLAVKNSQGELDKSTELACDMAKIEKPKEIVVEKQLLVEEKTAASIVDVKIDSISKEQKSGLNKGKKS